jgi:hypothetical protein
MIRVLCISISPFGGVTLAAVFLFAAFWLWFTQVVHKGDAYIFFDPQDYAASEANQHRKFPIAAKTATFEPMLKHYIGVTQLLVTVAAASIAFGGDKSPTPPLLIVIAKSFLAWSIFYGVLFCAFLLYRYDEYTQDMTNYTRRWYSTVESLGFSTLGCFVLGYLAWGWGLSR